ncbi:hypothetical protein ACJJIW_11250 [Microbulbifer sp. JMSA004]|uniref:hypothetical protein n=1 Tax=unclassified Microbulbifer TaxID=2619833 RepID=UPI0024ACE03E|nr:hypothetical protein [Microbulbifer sp. VAAF005]WHI45862.1 hypothetical protein P0078_19400 [Microbulbifer sp. VAAF005]
MPLTRSAQAALEAPYYHRVSNCLRKAALYGRDIKSGKTHEDRCEQIEPMVLNLASTLTIDIAAYIIINYHYHTVLYINKEKPLNWSDMEAILYRQNIFKAYSLTLHPV